MTDTTNMDPDAARELRTTLLRVDDLRSRAGRRPPEARPGALGAADADVPHARWVVAGANMAIGVAVDHLYAWQQLVGAGPIPIYAPMTLLRTALEAAVTTRWLVDPRPSARERVGRGIAAQLDDYDERRKFETIARARTPGYPPPSAGAKSAPDRIADLKADRDGAEIPVVRLLGPTELMKNWGAPGHQDFTWLYRLLSAFAHAKPWALHATNIGPTGPSDTAGLSSGVVTASDLVLCGATIAVTDTTAAALAELEAYLGIGPEA